MDNFETTTLAALAEAVGSSTLASILNGNLSQISEEDELKLLNFPSKREDLSTAIPLTVIFALLLVTGCIGNLCTAIVIARPKNKYMHTATNYYLFSLAMSDFLFLILGLPQEMYTLWQRYPYAFGESFCIIRGYLSEASTYASILTISAFTVERYVAICHPLWAHTMSQLPRAVTSIVIIWILAALCAIPPAAELGIITQKGPITNRTLEQSAQCATKRTIYENMFVVSAIVFFIVPMIIVTVLYILIAIELRRSSKMNSAISKQSSGQHQSQQVQCCGHQGNQLHLQPNLNRNKQLHHHRHHQNLSQPDHRFSQDSHLGKPAANSSNCCCGRRSNRSAAHQHHPADQRFLSATFARLRLGCTGLSSRSQQQLSSGCALMSQSSSFNQQHLPQTQTENLMANIMSQRPSSAIGTEQEREQSSILGAESENCAPKVVARANKGGAKRTRWPPILWRACGQVSGASARKRRPQLAINSGAGANSANQFAPAQGNSSSSSRSQSPRAAERQPQWALSGEARSPLSYHESLIQRRSEAPICANGAKLHSFPTHQMSLGAQPLAAAQQTTDRDQANAVNKTAQQHLHVNQQQQHQHHQRLNHHQYLLAHSKRPQIAGKQQHHQHQHHHHSHNYHTSRKSAAASSKKSVVRMLVAVVVSFFICWVPFHAQRLLASYLVKDENQNQLLLDIYLKLTYISGVMYYLSSTINPLLYQLMSAKFRLAFKETFKCSLFQCAILRRSPAAHSPSNSVRETPASHAHLRSHPPPLDGNLTRLATPTANGDLLAADCCSCCQTGAEDCTLITIRPSSCAPMGAAAAAFGAAGMLTRMRGHLNGSLMSLFRFNSNELSSSSCQCCGQPQQQQQQQNLYKARQESSTGIGTGKVGEDGQLAATCNASSPLLGIEDAARLQQQPARSMLKFVKSPTPSGLVDSHQVLSRTRLSSPEENAAAEDETQVRVDVQLEAGELGEMESLIRATESEADGGIEANALNLTLTSESGNSSSSSPDQLQQEAKKPSQLVDSSARQREIISQPGGQHQRATAGHRQRQKVVNQRSCGSNSSSGSMVLDNQANRQKILREKLNTRRASFQPRSPILSRRAPQATLANDSERSLLAGFEQYESDRQRRKSSTCSSGKHYSSSLSSSERQLDKKLSLTSTTTSAIDDCGSFTTTNSQLTEADSNSILKLGGQEDELASSHWLSRSTQSTGDEEGVCDETVIDCELPSATDSHTFDDHDEVDDIDDDGKSENAETETGAEDKGHKSELLATSEDLLAKNNLSASLLSKSVPVCDARQRISPANPTVQC